MAAESSDTNTLPMRIGVLIVGSLFWKHDETGIRAAWRDNRLDLASITRVDAPLRYGRRSQGWGDTFTMILDPAVPNGRALLASCKADVRSFADLLDEARWLWSAEDNKPLTDRFHKNWGCVAALFGPKAIAAGFPEQWKRDFQAANPPVPSAVNRDGLLAIPWPRTLDGEIVTSVDIILAIATMARPENERPSPRDVAKAWIDQKEGHERYFLDNVRHGIRTAGDAEIWSAMEEAQPDWLQLEHYAEVVDKLRRQANRS
jgi:hypothetical protein